MELSTNEDVSLDSTVLTAMMRLQNGKTTCSKQRSCRGVSCESIVKYLKSNISWIDGDVESQVITSLLSWVKTGMICALNCGKYRLIQPNSKNVVTKCESRVSHGSTCTCLKMLKAMVKTFRRPCCVLKEGTLVLHRLKKAGGKKSGKKSKVSRLDNCVLDEFGKSTSDVFKANGKCNYCLEFHSPPQKKDICLNCNCLKAVSSVPDNVFSPRDESSSEKFNEKWK